MKAGSADVSIAYSSDLIGVPPFLRVINSNLKYFVDSKLTQFYL